MKFSYDRKADVLYIAFEPSTGNHENVETEDGDVVKLDPETGHALGIVILDFMARVSDQNVVEISEIGHAIALSSKESLAQS